MLAQLIDRSSNQVLVDVYSDELVFHSLQLQEEIQFNGINLDITLSQQVENQRHFEIDDPLFKRAFSVYYFNRAKVLGLIWRKIFPPQ